MATWASVFPLDVIKTRLQAQTNPDSSLQSRGTPNRRPLLRPLGNSTRTMNSIEITRETFRSEGLGAFYRGLGVCSLRAFIVNAVQVCNDTALLARAYTLTGVVGDVRMDNEGPQLPN